MQKIVSILFLLSIFSCNDGDFEVPSFEFDETVNICGTYVLYRANSSQTEALIIQLDEANLVQEEAVTEISISAANCSYRIFDSTIDANYFCSDVPPVTPQVIKNWEAVAGTNNVISISSSTIIDEDTSEILGYEYAIVLSNLVLESDDEQIIHDTYSFGSVSILL